MPHDAFRCHSRRSGRRRQSMWVAGLGATVVSKMFAAAPTGRALWQRGGSPQGRCRACGWLRKQDEGSYSSRVMPERRSSRSSNALVRLAQNCIDTGQYLFALTRTMKASNTDILGNPNAIYLNPGARELEATILSRSWATRLMLHFFERVHLAPMCVCRRPFPNPRPG